MGSSQSERIIFRTHSHSDAVIIAGTFRLYQGGPGATVGVFVIVITACVGLAWRYWKEKHNKPLGWRQLYAFGITVQLAVLSCMFLMPADMRLPIIKAVAPPILIIFPVVTLLIGYILKRQEDRRHVHEVFRQYEKIVSSSSDMMALMDKQYRFIAANKAYSEAFGLTQKQLAGKKAADVLGEKVQLSVYFSDGTHEWHSRGQRLDPA